MNSCPRIALIGASLVLCAATAASSSAVAGRHHRPGHIPRRNRKPRGRHQRCGPGRRLKLSSRRPRVARVCVDPHGWHAGSRHAWRRLQCSRRRQRVRPRSERERWPPLLVDGGWRHGRFRLPRRSTSAAAAVNAAGQELSLARKLQHDVPVAGDPHTVVAIDPQAMLGPVPSFGPAVASSRTAPGLNDIALRVELDDWRGQLLSFFGREVEDVAIVLVGRVKKPGMVVRVHGHAPRLAQRPPVGRRLRPRWIELVCGNTVHSGRGR